MMVPFDRLCVISYYSSVVTMSVSVYLVSFWRGKGEAVP